MKRAPIDLSKKSKTFWNSISRDYQLGNQHYIVLTEICYSMDRLNEIRGKIAEMGTVIINPSGMQRVNPLLQEEHRAVNRLILSWKALDFAEEIPAQISNYQRSFG